MLTVAHTIASAIAEASLGFVFSDGHAIMGYTSFYDDLNEIDTAIDWDIMRASCGRDTDIQYNRTNSNAGIMLKQKRGNLLAEKTEALVNPVNCVGVMGKGVALQFKRAFPGNFKQYQKACKNNEVEPGRMFIVATDSLLNPRYIINFPTKGHWRQPSQLDDIKAGLAALVADVQRLGIRSIAIPPLGCGNGGLDWAEVKPLIIDAFKPLPKVEVIVFEPAGTPSIEAMALATSPRRV